MEEKGKVNVYKCPNGHDNITVNADEGVTPFMLRCRESNCGAMAQSQMYMVNQSLTPQFEWYKPTNMKALNPAERHHVEMGGLLIRKIR
jgi:hypothetical protein